MVENPLMTGLGQMPIAKLRPPLVDRGRINTLYPKPIEQMMGCQYAMLRPVILDAIAVRNKIFHGQLTDCCLQRKDLVELAAEIRRWCMLLADVAMRELGHDGFGRGSFRKSPAELARNLLVQIGRTVE